MTGWRTGLVLAGFALLVQGVFLAETAGSLLFRYPLVDAAAYYQQALAIASGHGTAPGAFWQPPLYPYLLAELLRMAGTDPLILRAAQALVLAPLTAVLLWRVARRVLAPAWSLACGLAVSATGPLFFYQAHLLPAAPAAALLTGILLLALRALERPTVWRWLTAGIVTGLATLCVGTCGALLPVLMVYAWLSGSTRRGRVLRAAAPLVGVLFVLTPVALRNQEASGRWVWISTNDGVNLYIGNNRDWDVTLAAQPGLDWDKLVRLPRQQGNIMNAADADHYFRLLAWQDAARTPIAAMTRLARKALVFWHGREIPRNLDIYGWRNQSLLLRVAVWRKAGVCFPIGCLVPLALVGALALLRRRAGSLMVLSAVAFGLLVALYFPCSRYRAPVLPVLVLCAGAGLQALCAALAARRWLAVGVCVALVLATGVAVNRPFCWPTDRTCYRAQIWNAIGAAADVRGDLATAASCFTNSLQADPQFADALFNLGTVFGRRKNVDQAMACYEAAIAARPDHDKARINLALHLAARGDLAAAFQQLSMAETVNPLNAEAFCNHAALKLRAGRKEEALLLLGRAAALDASRRPAYKALERSLAQPTETR